MEGGWEEGPQGKGRVQGRGAWKKADPAERRDHGQRCAPQTCIFALTPVPVLTGVRRQGRPDFGTRCGAGGLAVGSGLTSESCPKNWQAGGALSPAEPSPL